MEKKDRYARLFLSRIRKHYGKDSSRGVTWNEYVEFMGIPIEEVKEFLGEKWERIKDKQVRLDE